MHALLCNLARQSRLGAATFRQQPDVPFSDSCAIAIKQVMQQEKFQTCLDSISLRRNIAPIPICGVAELRASWTSWTSWTKMASENAQIPSWTGWSFMPRLLHPALERTTCLDSTRSTVGPPLSWCWRREHATLARNEQEFGWFWPHWIGIFFSEMLMLIVIIT